MPVDGGTPEQVRLLVNSEVRRVFRSGEGGIVETCRGHSARAGDLPPARKGSGPGFQNNQGPGGA